MFRSISATGLMAASIFSPGLSWSADASSSGAALGEAALEEVVVTATLREQALQDVPASITALTAQTLQDAGQQHFEDVMGLVPNLNWAGGTSRPRYFQIRGIGEREQYEGAPNSSVGFLIDDIDFSGLGMPATLFDIQQIEVLRGPQGTRYGANALAGLIAVRSKDPEQEAHYSAEASVGDYNTRSLGVAATAPIESLNSAWRLSLQQYRSDGYRSNPYLHRKDTDGRDELTGRFKWRWQINSDSTLDFTLLHADLDNGYDSWAIDNSRTSLSDRPGKDAERATGVALKWNDKLSNDLVLTVTGTAADTASNHAYDGDWGNTQSWQNLMHAWSTANGISGNAWQSFVYDYTYHAQRDRDTRSLDIRLASDHGGDAFNWLLGVYALNLREHIRELSQGDYEDPVAWDYYSSSDDYLDSRYDATNTAIYGQLDGKLAPRWSWSVGLRGERRTAKYHDYRTSFGSYSDSLQAAQDEDMWGGQASLGYDLSADKNLYVAVSRGYKAGGFNLGLAADAAPRFTQETLLSYELGAKGSALNGRVYFDTTLFYEQRHNMQVLDSKQLVAGDPDSFVFFTDNVGTGYNAGVESALRVNVSRALELGGSLGLLRTRTDAYLQDDGAVVQAREQAHAPEYTAGVYGVWRTAKGLMARVDVTAKDNFYYSNASSIQQSHAYSLTHIKLGYERPSWDAYMWVRNVFDKDYVVRAFEFGNEPPDFNDALYVQHGEPRVLGVTGSWKF
ncbi:MAG: TonB-dependent receptor [Steroidobacteraceae bacterium]